MWRGLAARGAATSKELKKIKPRSDDEGSGITLLQSKLTQKKPRLTRHSKLV